MPYIDGFLLTVPNGNLETYRESAEKAAQVWKDHGALAYYEAAGDDLVQKDVRSFTDAAGAKENETVIFAFAIFPSREVRDEANKKIMEDPRLAGMCEQMKGIFDCSNMAFGGFKTIVKA